MSTFPLLCSADKCAGTCQLPRSCCGLVPTWRLGTARATRRCTTPPAMAGAAPGPDESSPAVVMCHSRLQQGWQGILVVAVGVPADRALVASPSCHECRSSVSSCCWVRHNERRCFLMPFSHSTSLLCSGEFVASLLEAGADGTVKNDSNHTPYELVRWAQSIVFNLQLTSGYAAMQAVSST